MADEKDEKNGNVIRPKLWHEQLEGSKINEMATELIKKFLSKGVKVHKINVYWDSDDRFITATYGANLKRRVEDKKEPENH